MRKRLKALVIDNDRSILGEIKKRLRSEGLVSVTCSDFESAWEHFSRARFAVVITQYNSSAGNFCRKLRERDHTIPIILLYGRNSGFDLSETLKKGCDDFVIKPFDVTELAVRVRLALDRTKGGDGRSFGKITGKSITIDGLYIDPLKRICLVDGGPVDLTITEFNILHLLASNRGRTYSRREMLNLLWDYDDEVYEHTVNSHVNRLRAKIEDNPRFPRYIITVWGIGYRFALGDTQE
jgi:two-component system alkaline phosphatase synthesis response regulator PhoP